MDTVFWSLDAVPADRTALVVAGTGQVITYGGLRQMRDAVRARMDAGQGVCWIGAAPTPQVIAAYLAALDAGCPVILQDPQAPEGSGPGALPILYKVDGETGAISTHTDGAGLDLHPDLAILLSTSGSTGTQKFVRLSRRNLASNAAAIAEYLGLTAEDRAPTALPLAYSYGMSVLNSHLQVGASLLLTDAPVISEGFWQAFDDHRCTSFAGVPQSFALLARGGQLDRPRPALRYVTQAGGKLGPEAVREMARTGQRHGWSFFVMYGQTEAAPRISYLPPDLAESHPQFIGRAIPGGRLWVAGPDGAELPAGTEGELVYEGPNVMMGYATGPADLAGGQGSATLRTGDLGRADPETGLIQITGRAARFVKLSGKRVSLDEIGTWLMQDGVDGVAVGADDDLGLVHTAGRDLAPEIAKRLGVPAGFVRDIPVADLPLNQNGKPDLRAAQTLFAEHETATPDLTPVDTGDMQEAVIALFRRQFPGEVITPRTCFDDLGGSSNEFVELELALEAAGVPPRQNWQTDSVADLARRAGTAPAAASGPAPDYAAARVICTLLVVLLHVIGLRTGGGLDLPDSSIWRQINDFLQPLRMPFFALIAGFSFRIMQSAAQPPPALLKTVGLRLALPTAFAIAGFLTIATVLGTQFAVVSVLDVVRLLWLPYAHFWFIMALIGMMLISYAVLRYVGRWAGGALIALAVALAVTDVFITPDIWAINGVVDLMPLFVVGYFYAKHAPALHARWAWISAGAVLAVIAMLLVMRSFAPFELGPFAKPAGLLLSLGMITLCLLVSRGVPFLAVLAPYTFFIYLWHVVGTAGMRRALQMLEVEHLAPMIVMGMAAGVALPVVFYHLLGYVPGGRLLRGK
ncbi:MAG: AMP-binding protein [Pseudomonadota bacterium]